MLWLIHCLECNDKGSNIEPWEMEETIMMMVDKGLLNRAFKSEWGLFRKRGKGRSKIITRQFPLSIYVL